MPNIIEENILNVSGLGKSFLSKSVIDNLSFQIRPNEIIGLLGPNGAGKTTVIHILLGLLEPDRGQIQILGKDFPAKKRDILSQVNFTASYAELPGNLRADENLLIYAMLYGHNEPYKAVEKIMTKLELMPLKHRKTGTLSSGEKARLGFAKALLNTPRLLLMDEPTASLDPSSSDKMCKLIRSYVKEENAGALWTSHDMDQVEELCARVLFLSHGRIIFEGEPAKLPGLHGRKTLKDLFLFNDEK